jgi:hypothetical protein
MAVTNIQSFSGQVDIASNLTVDTSTLYVDTVTSNIGIGKTDPQYAVDVSGDINFTGTIYKLGSVLNSNFWTESDGDISFSTANVTIDNDTFHVNYTAGPYLTVGIGTTTASSSNVIDIVGGLFRITDAASDFHSDLSSSLSEITVAQTLTASDGESGDSFGTSVAISGDGSYALIGAPKWDGPDNTIFEEGAAYVFSYNGSSWVENTILEPSTPLLLTNQFGTSVDISDNGSYIAVGAPGQDTTPDSGENHGAVYVFSASGSSWTHSQTLIASDYGPLDEMGASISISGDGSYIVSGARRWDSASPTIQENGAVYVFSHNGSSWVEQQKITPSTEGFGYFFGTSVSVSKNGSYIAVGSPRHSNYFNTTGAVFIFSRSGSSWVEEQQLGLYDTSWQANDSAGQSVSMSADGSHVIVGAPGWDSPNSGQGSAIIFSHNGSSWVEKQRLTASNGAQNDSFGSSVCISDSGSYAFVGSPSQSTSYLFYYNGLSWVEENILTNVSTDFGKSFGMSGNGTRSIIGASGGQGAAYAYSATSVLKSTSQIEVNGTTILSFTGQHMCVGDGPMEQGLIVSANKNDYISLNGPLTTGGNAIKSSEALPVVSLSQVANDKTVFGVVDHVESENTTRKQKHGPTVVTSCKEVGDNRVIVNSLGEGAIWVVNTNGNIDSGDFLTTSNIAGYAQRQTNEDICYSYTVAKSTMDCNFNPRDVPVQKIIKNENGTNSLDEKGQLQWKDTDKLKPEYKIRYLTIDGQITDESNSIYTAAYIGCTYHCG